MMKAVSCAQAASLGALHLRAGVAPPLRLARANQERTMSRYITAAALVLATIACADPGTVTSPNTRGSGAGSAAVASCTAEQGQQLIDAGQYKQAIREFTCVIGADPTAVAGYRGRIEAELMLGKFSDAVRDYVRVNAFVVPVHPDAAAHMLRGQLRGNSGFPK